MNRTDNDISDPVHASLEALIAKINAARVATFRANAEVIAACQRQGATAAERDAAIGEYRRACNIERDLLTDYFLSCEMRDGRVPALPFADAADAKRRAA